MLRCSGPFPIVLQQARELACLMWVTRRHLFHTSLLGWRLDHAVYGAAACYHLSTTGWPLQECSSSAAVILHIPAVKLLGICRLSYHTSLPSSAFIAKDLNLEHTFSFITQICIYNLFKFNLFPRISVSWNKKKLKTSCGQVIVCFYCLSPDTFRRTPNRCRWQPELANTIPFCKAQADHGFFGRQMPTSAREGNVHIPE